MELPQVRSGADEASQLPNKQGLLMATREIFHESAPAGSALPPSPSHWYPAAKKHHVDYSRVGS